MLRRNAQHDSRVAVAGNRTPIVASVDFESEAMPHLNDLYRTALYTCPQSAKASHVVQETYLRAWIAFGKYRPRTNCKRWLFQILFNVVRLERQTCFTQVPEGFGSLDHAEPTGIRNIPDGNDVLSALCRLPMKFREVLLLVDCQGFSYKEAGEILGVSSGVVERHVVLGRNHLHSELEARCPALAAAAH
jgi:RNA polymerase sigma-70 factor, ECF subfamily